MITKERLKELIEQGATIWHWEYGKLKERELNKSYHINIFMNKEWLCKSYCDFDDDVKITHIAPFFEVFETKEEAEWYKEFGSIERTERLELPTWEEVSRDLENAPVGNYVIKSSDGWSLEYVKYNETVIGLYSEYVWSEWEATKENYILACRKAKELFLGEKK